MLTPETALADLRRLGFPPVFEKIWAGEYDPWGLACVCKRPRTFFEIAVSAPWFPRTQWCVPLWEENGETIVAFDKATGEFLEYFVEDEDPMVVGNNYQQFVTFFFLRLADAGFDEFPTLVELFGYRHFAEFERFIHTEFGNDHAACHKAELEFRESITDNEIPGQASGDFFEKR